MTVKKVLPHLAESLAELRRQAQMVGYEGEEALQRSVDIDGVLQAAGGMMQKLALSQAKGRKGWNDPEHTTVLELLGQLLAHLPKGDPIDWLNFSMMLWFRKDGMSEVEWGTALKEMIDAFCRDQLQQEYAFMDEVYSATAAEVKAEADAAIRGSLGLAGEVTIFQLVKAQAVINQYLVTVFGELREKLPKGCELIVQPGAREDGTPFFTLKVEATP